MVRLKEKMVCILVVILAVFQFLMVRLKGKSGAGFLGSSRSFQFLMVRLKGKLLDKITADVEDFNSLWCD